MLVCFWYAPILAGDFFEIQNAAAQNEGKYEENTYYIKRIIGLPGETVQIVDGYVYINGQKLDEHYGNEVMAEAGLAEEPVELGDDEYFVLGDNRNNSQDSRAANVGVIHRRDILGRAWVRIWPLDQFGLIRHE